MTLIEDYEETPRLEHALSVFDPNAYKVTFKAYRKFIKNGITNMVIPKHYPVKWLVEMFPDKEVVYNDQLGKNDKRVNYESLFEPRDSRQKKTLEWLEDNYQYSQKLISLKPGDGKTYIALKYICDEKRKALVVVHTIDILKQWKDQALKLTNIPAERICLISGKDKFSKAMKDHDKYDLFIAVHKTLHSAIEDDKRSLERFRRESGIGIKIVDEAHLELASLIAIDLNSHFTDNLYLTATPERTDFKQNKLYRFLLPVYFAFDLGNNETSMKSKDKYHICYFINFDLGCVYSDVQSMITNRGFNLNIWATWTAENNRVPMMVDTFLHFYAKAEKRVKEKLEGEPRCAILLKSLEQCRIFENELIKRGVNKEDIGQFNGNTTKAKKQEQLNHKYIISTEKSYGQAIDTRLDIMMDFVPYTSSQMAWQIAGRLRSGYGGLYYSFHDSSNFKCVDSKKAKMRSLKKKAASVIEINY